MSPFVIGDLAYVSINNMSLPKKQAQKLIPKFIRPYLINKDYGNNSYQLDLPSQLRQRGIHPIFHSLLLRDHVPNDNRLFPGHQEMQVADFNESDDEWLVDRIQSHVGSGHTATFKVAWTSGDTSWLPFDQVEHLTALNEYLELLDVPKIEDLSRGDRALPEEDLHIYCAPCSV